MSTLPGMGHDPGPGLRITKITHQFGHIFGKPIAALHAPAQGMIDRLITPWRTTQPKIDAVSMDGCQRPELFCNG